MKMPRHSGKIPAPSLFERIVARKSGDERSWFRTWLRVQGYYDPNDIVTEKLARSNLKWIIGGLFLFVVAIGCWVIFMGWVRKWW